MSKAAAPTQCPEQISILMPHPTASRYDPLSRALHWLTAVAVTVASILGPERFGRLMREGVDPAARQDIVWLSRWACWCWR
jgi:hypothetical protein